MKALVTGGAGFIGSNLVDALVADGTEVVVADNLSTGRRENLDQALKSGAFLELQDICDQQATIDLFKRVKPETVFHLAAQIDVRKSVADAAFDAGVNVVGTVNVLEAARQSEVKRTVYISTGGAIYGESDQIPTPETAAISPLAPYGQAKFAGEGYCSLYNRLHGLSTISLRLGNVYGPRQDPLGEAGVIAIFCGKLKAGEQPVIYGDGTQTRDYLHVSDVVAAGLAAGGSDQSGSFNIGSGRESSVLELIEILKPHATQEFEPNFQPARPGEVQRSALDASKAADKLGWQCQIELKAGVEQTLDA